MLTGTHLMTVDAKGRVVMPQAFLSDLGASFILTRAPGRCLLALPRPRWVRFLRGFGRNRSFRTFFVGSAESVQVGNNNRILVPAALRHWAELDRGSDVVVAGVGAAVVISNRERWDARLIRIEQDLLAALDSPELRLCSDCRER